MQSTAQIRQFPEKKQTNLRDLRPFPHLINLIRCSVAADGVPGDDPQQGRGAPQVQEGPAQQRQERGPLRGHQPHHTQRRRDKYSACYTILQSYTTPPLIVLYNIKYINIYKVGS